MILEALPAGKGDCLLLHYSDLHGPRLALIDGGPGGVYSRTLRPRLNAIKAERVLAGDQAADEPLLIDLAIISHIDDDHVNGVKALLADIVDNEAPFRIGRLWHNGFTTLVDANVGAQRSAEAEHPDLAASLGGELIVPTGNGDSDAHDLSMILASVQQGYDVVLLARRLGIPINPEFGGRAIEADGAKPLLVDGLKVTVLGPAVAELAALRKDFAKWLAQRGSGEASTAELLASFADASVPNLSSIVLLIEGDGERYLLTGDARGDKVMEAAESGGLLNDDGRLAVDVLKVPHHGSDRNITSECFAMFPADRYILSGNGEHGNPARKTLEMLAQATAGRSVTLELTYRPDEIDQERARFWNAKRGREPFDMATQGIGTFLAAQPQFRVRQP